MTAPRVPLLPADDGRWAEDLKPYLTPGGPIALFGALTASEAALADLKRGTTFCLTSSVPVRIRELVIVRVCHRTGALAEAELHRRLFGAEAAITEDDWQALHEPSSEWTHLLDQAAVDLADGLVDSHTVPQDLWETLEAALGAPTLIELLSTAGQYLKVAWISNALGLSDVRAAEEAW